MGSLVQAVAASVAIAAAIIGLSWWAIKPKLREFVMGLITDHFETHVAPEWREVADKLEDVANQVRRIAIKDAYDAGIEEGKRQASDDK